MTTLRFTISFHGPFRVGAAYGRDGIDAAIDTVASMGVQPAGS